MDFIVLLIVLLAGAAFFVFFNSIIPEVEKFDVKNRLGINKLTKDKQLSGLSAKMLKKLEEAVSKIKWDPVVKMRKTVRKLLNKSGNPGDLTVDGFIASQLVAAILMVFSCAVFFKIHNSLLLAFFAFLGFSLPQFFLKSKIAQRHKSIIRSLPDMLDLITLSMEAGIDFNSSINKVIAKSPPSPLMEELFLMQQGMRMGQTRKQALVDMAERVELTELSNVISAIVQAEQMGSSLGPVMRVQAEEMRIKRFQLAEQMAQKAPIKLLFPLLFFIFPAIFIMLFGPIALQFLTGGVPL